MTSPENAHLAKIRLYPIKSLDPMEVSSARIAPSGALVGDREFALFDQQGKYINGKNNPLVHRLRTSYDLPNRLVTISVQGETVTLHLDHQRAELADWFSHFFRQPVEIRQNSEAGFPDDTESPASTIVSLATLETVQSWFPDLSLEQIRLRFRSNLEIAGVPAFWEDSLYGRAGVSVPFQIGAVTFCGTNPCQRCPVPVRDPFTGENYPHFVKIFTQQRQATLPQWVEASRFNHFYRLTVNTKVPPSEVGKTLSVGDAIHLNPPQIG